MNDQTNRTAGYSGNSSRSSAGEPVRYQDRRPSGFSVGDRFNRNRNDSGYSQFNREVEVEGPSADPAVCFVFDGEMYNREVLQRLRGMMPTVYLKDTPQLSQTVIVEGVYRYPNNPTKMNNDLVFVDHNFRPVMVPANYDGKPVTRAYLVSKHSLKKAKV